MFASLQSTVHNTIMMCNRLKLKCKSHSSEWMNNWIRAIVRKLAAATWFASATKEKMMRFNRATRSYQLGLGRVLMTTSWPSLWPFTIVEAYWISHDCTYRSFLFFSRLGFSLLYSRPIDKGTDLTNQWAGLWPFRDSGSIFSSFNGWADGN